ncbi:hypothetical protein GGR51DRAFT_512622 [Nemania sp. FL0031]|nr:hypothetical protein GGR51DRAFT_512622 [Nemania sp. FL0031]
MLARGSLGWSGGPYCFVRKLYSLCHIFLVIGNLWLQELCLINPPVTPFLRPIAVLGAVKAYILFVRKHAKKTCFIVAVHSLKSTFRVTSRLYSC